MIWRAWPFAKLANHSAERLLPITGGVVDLCDSLKRDWTLHYAYIGEI